MLKRNALASGSGKRGSKTLIAKRMRRMKAGMQSLAA
jgi:hypothetical protein